eukprot:3934132-Rhodomonas_salina.2
MQVGNALGIASFVFLVTDAGVVTVRITSALAVVVLWLNLMNYIRAYRKGSRLSLSSNRSV